MAPIRETRSAETHGSGCVGAVVDGLVDGVVVSNPIMVDTCPMIYIGFVQKRPSPEPRCPPMMADRHSSPVDSVEFTSGGKS